MGTKGRRVLGTIALKVVTWVLFSTMLLGAVLHTAHAQNEERFGRDYLGLLSAKSTPARIVSKHHRQGAPVGILDFTFGTSTANLEYLLANDSPTFARVHIINNTCIRNQNCGAYEIGAGYTLQSFERAILARDPKIVRFLNERLLVYRALQIRFPNTKFLISPILEHNLSFAAWRVLADIVLAAWPGVQLVNSPMRSVRGERYRGAWLEEHGTPAVPGFDIYSHDGQDATDIKIADWRKNTARAKIAFTWSRCDNLRTQSPQWVDPRSRTAACTERMLEELVHITDPAPRAPRQNPPGCSRIPFDSSFIWKPFAENKGTGDRRANYPVLISRPAFTPHAQLVDFLGGPVARLTYYDKYIDGRNRYYANWVGASGLGGYEIQKKALAQSGNSYVFIKQDNKCYGPILTGRRQGSFR